MRTEDILHSSSIIWRNRPAVICQRGMTTYAELASLSSSIANSLRKSGVEQGSIVGVALLNAREFLAALFGVLEARCIAIPLSPQLPLSERARVISDTSVSWSIQTAEAGRLIDGACPLLLQHLDNLVLVKEQTNDPLCASRMFPEAAVIRHTSGTTGRSKGVVLSHRSILERTEASLTLLDVRETDSVLAPLPLPYHFIASALSFLRAGACIIDCATLTPLQMVEQGAAAQATMIYGSPIQYELMSRASTQTSLPNLRRAITTSALVPPTTAQVFHARFGIRLTQTYGVIEVGLPLWNIEDSDPPTALGRCLPPYEARIIDEHGEPTPRGTIGELVVRGPGLFVGYLCGDEAGVAQPQDGWFHTGDLVTMNKQGTITYVGRKKSVINSAGNKIFPEEVEGVLRQSPQIAQARVTAEPHPLLGSLVVAEIVAQPGAQLNIDTLRALCYKELSGYKVPKEFRVVNELPLTGSGKVVRFSPQVEETAA